MKLNIFRALAIALTQFSILFYLGGVFDLLYGFNQTSAGFSLLLLLFVLVPLLNLLWLVIEIRRSVTRFKHQRWAAGLLMPCVAVLFVMESIGIDLYLLSQMRM